MDEESRAQALRTLEELVLDAGEAVSYRQLASTLCLHVNRSKALLQEFVDKHATAHGLSVSMLLCGLGSGGGARTLLCPRADLETVRASLKPVLFEHVYAVSRASAALEGATLATASGDFEEFTPTIGAVANSVCAKRSQQEIGNLKINSYKSLTDDATTPSRVENKNSQNKESTAQKTDQKVVNGSASTPKPNSSIARSGSCATKSSKEASPESAVKTKESNSTSKGKSKSNISSFFNKPIGQQAAKQVSKIKEVVIKPEPKDVIPEPEEVASSNKVTSGNIKTEKTENTKGKNKKPTKIENKKSEKTEVKKESTKKSVVSGQRHGKVDKKRKRVLHVSDSEDSDKDDPFEEAEAADAAVEEDDDVIPATPNADVVKITSGIVNPKKRRKIIDKTYTTEDGYMVTRKEEVLESCSEDELEMKENIVDTNVKKEIVIEKKTPAATPKSKSKKKMPSPQKGKQASIMSFFKKKP